MPSFESSSAYAAFAHNVVQRARYVRDEASDRFLGTLAAQAADRVETLPTGMVLWRAALGHDWRDETDEGYTFQVPAPHPPSRMRPLSDRAKEGRANPKGIPVLYLATRRETALAEVRPWIGTSVSAAQFRLVRELRIVDCTKHEKPCRRIFPGGVTPPEYWDANNWSDVDDAFSRPVTPSDDGAGYAPTQVLAECFRAAGYDGLGYASALGEGHNVALFDTSAAVIINCGLFDLKRIEFGFEESTNPYFCEAEV